MNNAGNSSFVDYYELLGVSPGADITEIRRAFIRKAKEHHPDAGGATDMMQQMNAAYKTLMSAKSKAAYDMLHNFHTGTTKLGDYHYHDGREARDTTDMSDDEIDSFLDSLFNEYRHGPPEAKPSAKQRFKRLFDL